MASGGRHHNTPSPSTIAWADGSGDTLGEAILACLDSIPRPRGAVSPVARFRQLFGTRAGYEALERAWLDVSPRTIQRWIAGEQRPGKANAEKINRAYSIWHRRPSPDIVARVQGAVGVVTGEIKVSDDSAVRTVRLDHSVNTGWLDFLKEWRRVKPDTARLETIYTEHVAQPNFRDAEPEWPGEHYRFQLE